MKSFNEYLEQLNFSFKSPKSDDPGVVEKGMVKFNSRPSDHDQWKCNKCGQWNSVDRKECSSCRRQHGGERLETRNGSLLLKSMIKSLEDAIHELSLGQDMIYNTGLTSFLDILNNQKEILKRKLADLENRR